MRVGPINKLHPKSTIPVLTLSLQQHVAVPELRRGLPHHENHDAVAVVPIGWFPPSLLTLPRPSASWQLSAAKLYCVKTSAGGF
jgi:hypothetical protein